MGTPSSSSREPHHHHQHHHCNHHDKPHPYSKTQKSSSSSSSWSDVVAPCAVGKSSCKTVGLFYINTNGLSSLKLLCCCRFCVSQAYLTPTKCQGRCKQINGEKSGNLAPNRQEQYENIFWDQSECFVSAGLSSLWKWGIRLKTVSFLVENAIFWGFFLKSHLQTGVPFHKSAFCTHPPI